MRVSRAQVGVILALLGNACVKKSQGTDPLTTTAPPPLATAPAPAPRVPPSPAPRAPKPPAAPTNSKNTGRFLELWTDIHDFDNGYFSAEGIPYHSVETLLVEAPDHGHETTSEAYSYWVWMEALYGKVSGDFSFLKRSWQSLEYFMIPAAADQPSTSAYRPNKPASYAPEGDEPSAYPVPLDGSVAVGRDPIGDELKATYGTSDVYAMHWLLDVDNWFGFGQRGDGTSKPSFINTFQRGTQESVWEAITQPAWDNFRWGGKHGFLDLFTQSGDFAKQWKYTNAPDADARAIQAIYWAKRWADERGGDASVNDLSERAAQMGDNIRYAFFDKYFKTMGCTSLDCAPAKEYESAHYLVSWYFAWGGAIPERSVWSWRIGSSHVHSGYQNPMAAYALSNIDTLKPRSPRGSSDWAESLSRQLEFYRWLQAAEGGIAGGATNSWKGRYEAPPPNTPQFYGMAYDASPVFTDPPSNEWFGFQVWSLQRVAEYYYVTGDPRAELILKKWVSWALSNVRLDPNGGYSIPSSLKWSGKPSQSWDADNTHFDPKEANFNSTLHVSVTSTTDDVGTTAGLVHTLSFYAKRANDREAERVAGELLDRMWAKYRDPLGLANPEVRKDYKRFADKLELPKGWVGKMPNGDSIDNHSTFLSIRSKFKRDTDWPKVQKYLDGGAPPEFKYHRFWAQAHLALAYGTYGWLFEEKKNP
ncbi:MAG: glycoside hydrolase family 48 protein [Polyangiaceae bacterium]|nr:glycoside hydrolase family 48 protein [Polyangiaceae bacterium]